MDDLERAVAARLRAGADGVVPPYDLGERVHARVRARRRRRRLAEAACVVTAVVTAAGVPALLHVRGAPDQPRLAASTVRPGGRAGPPLDHVATISRTLPGGTLFTALALAADGTVIGRGVTAGRPGGGLWRSAPDGGPLRPVTGAPSAGAADTDGRRIVWPQNTDARHDLQLMCVEPGGAPRRLGDRGVAATAYAFAADGGVVVWNDEATGVPHTVWAARSCRDEPRQVFHGGSGIAFDYPEVLVAGETDAGGFDGRLTQVNVDSGDVVPLRLSGPAGVLATATDAVFAANRQVLAWADGRRLSLVDRRTGTVRDLPVRLPRVADGEAPRLTAGAHLLVYTAGQRGDAVDDAGSLVYDLRTGRSYALAGDAYAAGDWLLWRDGAAYRVGRVR